MLWSVPGTSFFLLGSIHVSDRPLSLSTKASHAVETAEILAFEANVDVIPDLAFARYKASDYLSQNIPSTLFADAQRCWKEFQLPEEELQTLRPWWAAFCLMNAAMANRKLVGEKGIDSTLLRFAKKRRKKLFFLERPDAGLLPFHTAPFDEQIVFLSRVAQHTEEALQEVTAVIKAWESGNPANLLPIVHHAMSLMPLSYAGALGGRNKAWLRQLLRLLRSGRSVVVAVGALHMVGPNNIPSLLEAEGYDCQLVTDD